MSPRKTGIEGIVNVDGLIILRVLDVLGRVSEVSIHELQDDLAQSLPES